MTPWRQIAVPHKDVLEGTFQQAAFAVDLFQVTQGEAAPEYQNAEQFFARTYITEGMRLLLISVAKRLAGKSGDPVIQLQTNFGGGKTHTLLAVYHLAKYDSVASMARQDICPGRKVESSPYGPRLKISNALLLITAASNLEQLVPSAITFAKVS